MKEKKPFVAEVGAVFYDGGGCRVEITMLSQDDYYCVVQYGQGDSSYLDIICVHTIYDKIDEGEWKY